MSDSRGPRASPSDRDRDEARGTLFENDAVRWRRGQSREIRAELLDHIERRTASLIAAGYSPHAARAEALRRLGDMTRIEEDCMRIAEWRRSRKRFARWLDDLARDVAVALRAYRTRPLLAVGVVLTIALAIGAATSVFSMVRGVLLAPLAYPRSSDLYSIYTRYLPETGYDFEYFPISGPELTDYREGTRAMAGIAAYGGFSMNVMPGAGEAERLRVVLATTELFDVLGVQPTLGRGFVANDGEAAAPCVAVLGEGVWRDRFGADPGVTGRDLGLNGDPCTVVGVMPAGFAFPDERTRMYAVLKLDPTSPRWERESHPFFAVARLARGSSEALAQAELDGLRRRWSEDYPEHHARGHFLVLRPLAEDIVGDARTPLLVLLGAVGVVLLIVTVNVAGLMLAGAEARRKEFAVRTALGVSRARLLRQLLTESMVLAVVGGALGVVASKWIVRALLALYPGGLPRAAEIGVDSVVVLFGVTAAFGCGMLFGLFPAIRMSAVRVSDVLRTAGRGLTAHGGGVRARRVFVIAQSALALLLALGAALLARSYAHVRAVDLGFNPDNALTFAVAVPAASYPESERARGFFLRLEERLASLPGVEAAGAVSDLPLRSAGGADDFIIEGEPPPAPGQPAWNARYQMATPAAFPALGLELASGRWFESTDVAGGLPVAVVNEATARTYFGGENPIGRRIRYYGPDSTWITIVGVVRDVKQLRVTEDAPPAIYTALAQAPRPGYAGRLMSLVVRFQGNPTLGAGAVRAAVAELDPTLPPSQLTTLDAVVTEAIGGSRFTTTLMAAFAVLALVLGALGVYGVLAHLVNLRRHEIGIRLALGAAPLSVLGMVVRQGLTLVLAGTAVALVGALALGRTVQGLLFGVQPLDPASLMLATGTLLLTSLAACCIPAWRAARLDPLTALREE